MVEVRPRDLGQLLEAIASAAFGAGSTRLAGREQAVAELYCLGLSLRDIPALPGCSTVAVKWALARAGDPLRQRGSHRPTASAT